MIVKAKIAIIHGWGYDNYSNQTNSINPWRNRKKFIDNISKKYDLFFITLPGFCQQEEPANPWTLDDYTKFVNERISLEKVKPDFILGYSFGAAVALNYKLMFKSKEKLILVSPAIARKYKSKENIKLNKLKHIAQKLPDKLSSFLHDSYLSYIVKNPYYYKGNKFIKQSYLNIVNIDLSDKLSLLNKSEYRLVFGENDTATPPNTLLEKNNDIIDNVDILKNGTHDIANTNTEELIGCIDDYIKNYIKIADTVV